MSRMRQWKDSWTSPCGCLQQAFLQARTGAASASVMRCISKDCPVREVEPSVIDGFPEFIGALQDEALSKPVTPLR